jgi:hypothetical protein
MPRAAQQQKMHRRQQEVGLGLAFAASLGQGLEFVIAVNRLRQHRIKRRAHAARILGEVFPMIFLLGVQRLFRPSPRFSLS